MLSDPLIEKEKALFESSCLAHFQFLVTDFGSRVVDLGKGQFDYGYGNGTTGVDIRVVYQNETTGISFQTISYGHELGVSLYQLVDGQRSEDPKSAYGLDWIILLRRPSLKRTVKVSLHVSNKKQYIGENEDFAAEYWQEKSDRFNRVFSAYATALRQCAADVLQGDFTIFDELRQLRYGQWYELWNKWDKW